MGNEKDKEIFIIARLKFDINRDQNNQSFLKFVSL